MSQMSKYDNFEIFISEVISEANGLCIQRYGKGIDSLCYSDSPICSIIKKLLTKGWASYISVVTLLDLSESSLNDAMKTFLLSPIGMEMEKMQEGKNIDAVRLLMLNKKLPISVKKLGDAYKNDFECHINEVSYIDCMIANIAEKLLLNMLDKN